MVELIVIAISSCLVSNVVLSQFLGICSFLGVSTDIKTAAGMGGAVVFVITIASFVASVIDNYILIPLNMVYLETIVFILVIAALVQIVEMFMHKCMESLYSALGIYLPLIPTNCAVLGIAIINIAEGYNLLESFTAGIAAGLGFTLAIILMSNIREKLEMTPVRKVFRGVPIAFISASLMALAFMGFDSSLITNLHLG